MTRASWSDDSPEPSSFARLSITTDKPDLATWLYSDIASTQGWSTPLQSLPCAYVAFGHVLTVSLALYDRLKNHAPALARVIAGWGMLWSCLLIASGAVAHMGMEYVVSLRLTDAIGAVGAWQIIESIVNGLGGYADLPTAVR